MNSRTTQRSPLARPLLSPTSSEEHDSDYGEEPVQVEMEEEVEPSVAESRWAAHDEANRLLLQSLYGRAYATRWNFWWQHLPSAAVLGASVGVALPLFLWTSHEVRSILFSLGMDEDGRFGDKSGDHSAVDSGDHRHWWWLMLTIGGSLLSSLVLQFPMAPKPESLRTVLHHLAHLDGSVAESLYTLLSSWIALTCGAPIGVDLAVSTIGSGLANVMAISCRVDQRSHALYLQAGIAAAFSILLPSPLLGLLLVQELRIATRPGALSLQSMGANRAIVEDGRTQRRLRIIQEGGHAGESDLLEQVTIDGVAVIASTATVSAIFPSSWQSILCMGPFEVQGRDFEYSDWLLAIPMGVLSGIAVSIAAAFYLKWNWSRVRACQYLQTHGCMSRISRQLFAGLAGLVFGIIGIIWGYPSLFENGVNAWQRVVEANSNGISAYEVLHFGVHVIIGLAISVGCGLLGGPVLPMLVVGACVGVGVSSRVVPLALTLPCCMAACVGAFVPAPFTVISTLSLVFGLDTNQTISVFISTMAACTCTGGTGGLRCMGQYAWGIPRSQNAIEQLDSQGGGHDPETASTNEGDANRERPPADFEILQGVRSVIFGSAAPI